MSETLSSNAAPSEAAPQPTGPRWWRILGWSCYLACSWTWCIGMFLPVLLLRDFGPWSFIVFAVPNVVGAAAMGWVLRRPGSAGKLREDHERVVRLFTEVTVTFQMFGMVFFLFMMVPPTRNWGWPNDRFEWAMIGLFVAAMGWMVFLVRRRMHGLVATGTWALSAGLLALVWLRLPAVQPVTPMISPMPPLGLIGVCAFGFALCPYLDRTFLKASHHQSSADAKASFTMGFGFFFLAMILGTLGAASLFSVRDAKWSIEGAARPIALMYIAHALLQLTFTVAAHADRSARMQTATTEQTPSNRGFRAGIGAFLFCILIPNLARDGVVYSGLSIIEITYRLFMAFYGLIFPAYVWLCMIPNWLKGPPSHWQIRVWLGACLLASPMYWLGFIERETWWLGPGVGLVLLARVLIKARPHALAVAAIEPGPFTPPPPSAPPAGASPAV